MKRRSKAGGEPIKGRRRKASEPKRRDAAAEGIPSPAVTLGGARSTVDVPMLKDNELIGAFSIYRQEVRP